MSLIEILTVLAIVGICVGFFYTVFYLNWQAFDSYIARADFGQELNQMMDGIAQDGRQAAQITCPATTGSAPKTLNFTNTSIMPNENVTYTITSTNQFLVNRNDGKGDVVITNNINYSTSNFTNTGRTTEVVLTLTGQFLKLGLTLSSAEEIYSRN